MGIHDGYSSKDPRRMLCDPKFRILIAGATGYFIQRNNATSAAMMQVANVLAMPLQYVPGVGDFVRANMQYAPHVLVGVGMDVLCDLQSNVIAQTMSYMQQIHEVTYAATMALAGAQLAAGNRNGAMKTALYGAVSPMLIDYVRLVLKI